MFCHTEKELSVPSMNAAVVDSRLGDYTNLPRTTDRRKITWRFLTTGQDALRLARTQCMDLWIINTVLEDMSGIDLCCMLRNRSPPPVIYIVTDAYCVEDEQAARICGVSMFECKPIKSWWFVE
jgi:DNA-binding response OmpR family regulator